MTKTMKKVLTIVLVGLLAISASFMGIFTGSAATVVDNKAAFIEIIENYMDLTTNEGTITDADLADAEKQIDLVNAKAYFDKMTEAEKTGLESKYAEAWADILYVAGSALNVYAEMSALSVYIRPVDAPRISVHKLSDVKKADLNHQGLGANSVLFCDMRIDYDVTESYYATKGTKFFEKLYEEIQKEQDRIDEAEKAIAAIWEGVEVVGLDRQDEYDNATAKIEEVLPSDRSKIPNYDNDTNIDYKEAGDQLQDIKDFAKALADEIEAFEVKDRHNYDGNEIYYTKKTEINALKGRFDKLEETTANAVQTYFKTTHATQYAKLEAMLAYCGLVETEIAEVIKKIDAIGTVTYTDESRAKIDAAQGAFDDLDNDVKTADYITNKDVLDAAQDRYVDIMNAVDDVVVLIDAIDNPVTLTDACNAEIVAAEKAYAALAEVDTEFQGNVPADKVAIMEAARAEYIRLENIVKSWIARVKAFYGEGAITDIWAADLAEIDALETEYAAFDANAKAYADAPKNNNNVTGAKADLDAIKVEAYASIDETEIAIGKLKTATPDVIVELLLDAKEMYDTLHATQQAEIDPDLLTILNAKWAKYQAVSYFDKAVAIIKANVEAKLYFEQDATLMNTLFVLYNVLDEEGRAMVQSYDDLVAIEVVLADAELINVYEYSNELATRIEQANNSIAQLKADLDALNAELSGKIDELNSALEKANSTATIAMVIAIIATVAAIAGIVLVFTKKN